MRGIIKIANLKIMMALVYMSVFIIPTGASACDQEMIELQRRQLMELQILRSKIEMQDSENERQESQRASEKATQELIDEMEKGIKKD